MSRRQFCFLKLIDNINEMHVRFVSEYTAKKFRCAARCIVNDDIYMLQSKLESFHHVRKIKSKVLDECRYDSGKIRCIICRVFPTCRTSRQRFCLLRVVRIKIHERDKSCLQSFFHSCSLSFCEKTSSSLFLIFS